MSRINNRSYITFLIASAVVFINADLNLLSPNLSIIADEFGFSQREKENKLGGTISIFFFMVGAPSAITFGYLSDKFRRVYLLSFIMILSETACLLTYFSVTYTQLLVCRIFTGVGVGGSVPIIFSLLGDLYSSKSRIYVSTVIGISMSAGIAIGQLISGLLGPLYGWRVSFLCISIPSLCLAFTILLTAVEPERGQEETRVEALKYNTQQMLQNGEMYYQSQLRRSVLSGGNEVSREVLNSIANTQEEVTIVGVNTISYDEKINLRKLKKLFSTPSVLIIIFQGIPGCIPWGFIYVYMNDFLIHNSHFNASSAAFSLFLFGIGGIIGQLLGGYVGQLAYNIDKRLSCLCMGVSTACAIPIMQSILYLTYKQLPELYSYSFFGGFFCSITGPIVRSILQNVCIPEVRGSAFAIFALTDDLGKGFGPVIIVEILKHYALDERSDAFSLIFQFWIICSVLLCALILTISKDVTFVEDQIKSSCVNTNNVTSRRSDESYSPIYSRDDLSNRDTAGEITTIGSTQQIEKCGKSVTKCDVVQSPLHLASNLNLI